MWEGVTSIDLRVAHGISGIAETIDVEGLVLYLVLRSSWLGEEG
jgi:hypothetical protein